MTKKKEVLKMTDILLNISDYLENEDIKEKYKTPKIDEILIFLKFKAKAKKAREETKKYIEKNKTIRNGKAIVKGTRITTKEILLFLNECENFEETLEYICNQYPSIESKEQVLYALLYEIDKYNTLLFIFGVMTSNK